MKNQMISGNTTALLFSIALFAASLLVTYPAQVQAQGFCGAGCATPGGSNQDSSFDPGNSVGSLNFSAGGDADGQAEILSSDAKLGNVSWTETRGGNTYNIYVGKDGQNYAVKANDRTDDGGSSGTTRTSTPISETTTNPIDPSKYQPGWPNLKPIDISFRLKDDDKIFSQKNLEVGRYRPRVTIRNNGCLPTNYEAPEGAAEFRDLFNQAVKQQESKGIFGPSALGEPSLFKRFLYLTAETAHAGKKGRKYANNMKNLPCANVDTLFKNAGKKGKDGTFPVQLRIDFNNDGSWNHRDFKYDVGPLGKGKSTTIGFANVTLPAGTHKVQIIVDPLSGTHSCGDKFGCIDEPKGKEGVADNMIEEIIVVRDPKVRLGTFLINKVKDHNFANVRVIDRTDANTNVDQVGLWWKGTSIDYSTCQGWGWSTATGDLTSFTGQPQARTSWTTKVLGTDKYDRKIQEPPTGEKNTYTIRCRTSVLRNWVKDSVTIRAKKADEPDVTGLTSADLYPVLDDINADPGEEFTVIPFTAFNSTTTDLTNVQYTLVVDGTTYGSGTIGSLPANSELDIDVTGSWTAPTVISTTSMRVTLTHPDLSEPSYDDAEIYVNTDQPDGCHDGSDNDNDGLIDDADPDCPGGPDNPDPDPDNPGDEGTCDDPAALNDGADEDCVYPGGGPTCIDGIDNDKDGLTDLTPGFEDPDCDVTNGGPGDEVTPLPTISAYPQVVRSGDTTHLEWNAYTRTCNILPDIPSVSNPITGIGDANPVVDSMTIFSIDCGLVSASTTVRVSGSVEEN